MQPILVSRIGGYPIVKIFLFFALAFLITWGTGMVVVFSTHSELVNNVLPVAHPIPLAFPLAIFLVVVGSFGPALAALIVTALDMRRAGVRDLLRQFRRWRVGWIWFATAFLGPTLLALIALALSVAFGGLPPARWFGFPQAREFAGWAFGPWGEELGWRGYAQPTLQCRWSAFRSSLLVGTMWWTWHHWVMATPASSSLSYWSAHFGPSGAFLAFELANSVLMAWLYNSTNGSLPIAWAAHVGLSLGGHLVRINPYPFGFFLVVFWMAAVLVIVVNGPRTLSRVPPKQLTTQARISESS